MRSAETVLGIIRIAEDTGEPGAPKGCAVKTASRIPVADRGSRERCFRVNRLTRR
jgi:hypothetical protein